MRSDRGGVVVTRSLRANKRTNWIASGPEACQSTQEMPGKGRGGVWKNERKARGTKERGPWPSSQSFDSLPSVISVTELKWVTERPLTRQWRGHVEKRANGPPGGHSPSNFTPYRQI